MAGECLTHIEWFLCFPCFLDLNLHCSYWKNGVWVTTGKMKSNIWPTHAARLTLCPGCDGDRHRVYSSSTGEVIGNYDSFMAKPFGSVLSSLWPSEILPGPYRSMYIWYLFIFSSCIIYASHNVISYLGLPLGLAAQKYFPVNSACRLIWAKLALLKYKCPSGW